VGGVSWIRALWTRRIAGLAAAVSVLMIANPAMASGVQPLHVINVTRPFNGTVAPSEYRTISGCSNAKVTFPAFFNLSAGTGGFSDSSSARTCASSPTANGSEALSGFVSLIDIPFHAVSPTIYVNLSYALGANATLVPGNCPPTPGFSECDTIVGFGVIVRADIVDVTLGTRASTGFHRSVVSMYTENLTICNHNSCSWSTHGKSGPVTQSRSVSWLFTLLHKMVRGDRYVLELQTTGDAYSLLYSSSPVPHGPSGSAMINFATLGKGIVLTAIVET
jgi:hypothetical protein